MRSKTLSKKQFKQMFFDTAETTFRYIRKFGINRYEYLWDKYKGELADCLWRRDDAWSKEQNDAAKAYWDLSGMEDGNERSE